MPFYDDIRHSRETPTEYGGGPGSNRLQPNGRPRELTPQETAQDVRRAGLAGEGPAPADTGVRLR